VKNSDQGREVIVVLLEVIETLTLIIIIIIIIVIAPLSILREDEC